ncbi:hypothetical protein BDN72DRAFT_912609 [Pluteus cervinus]|uniref:Uncharacterized protein n=1 Tax=Pluteus cervinus TaxID=181527 RepID=A0ACD2ZY81_9AGAR|nr:hypothetical protein BDN72DRAFT_912609 [Pluteus cervinus]
MVPSNQGNITNTDILLVTGVQHQTQALTHYISEHYLGDKDTDGSSDDGDQASDSEDSEAEMEMAKSSAERGPYNQYPKLTQFLEIIQAAPEDVFRSFLRLGRTTFHKLVLLLEKNPIFQSTGRKPQRPVYYQLATFLIRYGSYESDGSKTAVLLGIAEGSVWNYCRRVSRALRIIGLQVITWGDENRQQEVSHALHGLLGLGDCIGIIDGTLIRLDSVDTSEFSQKFYCRKKYPAVWFHFVDHQKRFISYDMGWPGSMNDVTILKASHLWINRRQYFTGNEYLLADRGMYLQISIK